MNEQTFWIEVTKVLATVLAASVAAWVAYELGTSQRDIALEQKRIAQAKLNLELFEKRYEMFYKVWEFLSTHGRGPTNDPNYGNFTNDFPKATFLFGEEIADYMREAHLKKVLYDSVSREIRANNDIPMPDTSKRIQILDKWFTDEAVSCYKRFGPYMDFGNWKRTD